MRKAITGFILCGLVSLGLPPLRAQETVPARSADFGLLPDSPGASRSASLLAQDQASQDQRPQRGPDEAEQQSSPPATPQSSTAPQKPVGTAAAEAPTASGIAASQPSGVAIAPAKQRRARTIVLRVGAIVGAGVALGTVVALSEGTSSKPPGAH